MYKIRLLKYVLGLLVFSVFSGCGYIEGEYEVISDEDLREAGIEVPFPSNLETNRDDEGNWLNPNEILREDGFILEQRYGQIHEVVKGNEVFEFSTQLKRTYFSERYVIFTDGNRGIEDGFFRYFLRPIYSRLNTFDRETFELLDQRIIHGRVRSLIILDDNIYFHVADYLDEGFYGRYRISK